MLVTKITREKSEFEVDNVELLSNLVYTASADVVGYLWHGQKASLYITQKFSKKQSFTFTKPADDLIEIIKRLTYETGDFQKSFFVSVNIEWEIGNGRFFVELTHENAPEEIKCYFFDESGDVDLYDFYPNEEDY